MLLSQDHFKIESKSSKSTDQKAKNVNILLNEIDEK